jgi:NAD(P)-dependent dehydrogenase (short-subunit alcohol dehydrogenase family)
MSRLDGKVAVITGGSSGIGLATAQRFVQEGAYVFITGRRQSELDKAKALIGNDVTTVAGDASKNTDLDKLFATVLEEKGGLDILVANSGRVEPEELAELNGRGIRFNTLSPGPIDTPIMDGQADSVEGANEIRAQFAAAVPLHRMGRPKEIASAALILASDDSSFVAGAELSVDGGMAQV